MQILENTDRYCLAIYMTGTWAMIDKQQGLIRERRRDESHIVSGFYDYLNSAHYDPEDYHYDMFWDKCLEELFESFKKS